MLMTFTSRASIGVQLGENAAKPMTPVQDCVPTFVKVNIYIHIYGDTGAFSCCVCGH